MKFTTDSYIEIGNSHNICEDYALNGNLAEGVPFIIVADGCSSSKMTDFGSRILAHSCHRALHKAYHGGIMGELQETEDNDGYTTDEKLREHIMNEVIYTSMDTLDRFSLPYDVGDATLMYAYVFNNKVYVHGYGDGNLIMKMRHPEGKFTLWDNFQYESNAPFYLSYRMDVLRKKGYLDHENFGGLNFVEKSYNTLENGKPFNIIKDDCTEIITRSGSIENIDSITLSSDGMESYSLSLKRLREDENPPTEEEIQSLKPYNIMQRMVAYKNFKGEFVKRRMKRLKQEVEKIGGEHFDDVSSATIWIDHG